MRFSKPKKEEISLGISMAPLIDIVLLLLIFFILTSHFDTISGIGIKLPDISNTSTHKFTDSLVVIINRDGECFIKNEKISFTDLYKMFNNLSRPKKTNLIIQADRNAMHGQVVEVMDLAKRAGISSITISAEWKPDKVL